MHNSHCWSLLQTECPPLSENLGWSRSGDPLALVEVPSRVGNFPLQEPSTVLAGRLAWVQAHVRTLRLRTGRLAACSIEYQLGLPFISPPLLRNLARVGGTPRDFGHFGPTLGPKEFTHRAAGATSLATRCERLVP
jgi:hypothetical protein